MLYFSAPRVCSRLRPVYSITRRANSSKVSSSSGSSRNCWMRFCPRRCVSGPVSTMVSDRSIPGRPEAHAKLLRPPIECPIR